VLYVEGLKENLLSIIQFCDDDLVVQFSKKNAIFSQNKENGSWEDKGQQTTAMESSQVPL
jgi:hypothetical protein